MNRVLVTLGTDGFTNWVKVPNGQKFSLGVCSPLRFVVELAAGGPAARRALDDFNQGVETMLSVDLDKMQEVLRGPRRRWGTVSFIDPEGEEPRSTLMSDFAPIEQAVTASGEALTGWSRAAKDATAGTGEEKKAFYASIQGLFEAVKAAKAKLSEDEEAPEESDKSASDSEETPKEEDKTAEEETPKEEDKPAEGVKKEAGETMVLSYDTFKSNADLAQETLKKLGAVQDKIESIKDAKFDSVRASGDVLQVTTKVAGILQDVDLTQPWVAEDLRKLSARAEQLHSLFFPVKSE